MAAKSKRVKNRERHGRSQNNHGDDGISRHRRVSDPGDNYSLDKGSTTKMPYLRKEDIRYL
eukprot:4586944-Ditylum_brightwellii.AAC.1